jgi:hypothetical protein
MDSSSFYVAEIKASRAKGPKHEWFEFTNWLVLVRLLILVKSSHSKYSFEIVVYLFYPFCQKSAIPDHYCGFFLLLIVAELIKMYHLFL